MNEQHVSADEGFLSGIRVVELADEVGEYCGKVLAGLGADVIKVEPLAGEITRSYGPFAEDIVDPDRSLHFWHYNYGKRGVTLDLDNAEDHAAFSRLLATADVLLDTRPPGELPARGFDRDSLQRQYPQLIHARITPFGEDGPWANYRGSDLVHLALGGVMMNCGYDPRPDGTYDTPPIAPQMHQAYQIAGEIATIGIVGTLIQRMNAGRGDRVSVSVHESVSANTETDLPNWIFRRQRHLRMMGRHSGPTITPSSMSRTADGRWMLPYRTYLRNDLRSFQNTVRMLTDHDAQADLADERYLDPAYRALPEVSAHICRVVDAFNERYKAADEIWRLAQTYELAWAPIRLPHENAADEHLRLRDTFFDEYEPLLGRTITHVGARWHCEQVPWRHGPRAPHLGEHNGSVLGCMSDGAHVADTARTPIEAAGADGAAPSASPLVGVRIIDLSWLLASAGAGRFLAAMGAEVIKVEHSSKWDTMRWGVGMLPIGGRAARDKATEPLDAISDLDDPNRSGSFMEINAGKLGISLNLKTARGLELLKELIKTADMVIEGFSPGTMNRMGLGYDVLRELNPRLVYVQQSGLGQHGTYGGVRTYGPSAAAFSGLFEQSGLANPHPPAGIGYSYLDWFGAYNMACAMIVGIFRQRRTGEGCYIDSSQVGCGIYLTGSAMLDYSVNDRVWERAGNRAVAKLGAPHGAYPCAGEDRWIAISCYTEDDWNSLTAELSLRDLKSDERFRDLNARLNNQDALDALIAEKTNSRDDYELMTRLQERGVAAGVCQNASDRHEHDPQLAADGWLVELPQSSLGVWPVKRVPIDFGNSVCAAGGPHRRSGPNYGEDNEYVFGTVLGLDPSEIARLSVAGII